MTRCGALSEHDWAVFQFAIARRSLYVLGAGASVPIIGGDLASQIRRATWENGIYLGAAESPSPLKQRLLLYDIQHDIDAMRAGSISQNELDSHTPNALVEILLAQRLTLPRFIRAPQYAVFDRFAPSVLLNFNNDNLGDAVHPKHLCLRPHGAIEVRLVHSQAAMEAIRWLAIPESWIEQLRYHRPLPEPGDITNRRAYRLLPRCFAALQAVVIIGYSFGEQPHSGPIHDVESFELLVDLLRWRPKPVLVIGPTPDSVAARIEAGTKRHVSILACKWNALAQFLLSGAFSLAYERSWRRDVRVITPEYRAFEERLNYMEVAARCEAEEGVWSRPPPMQT